jgi:protein-tyrosine-phosphatase|tara:strand:+ start:86 stop:721 length:636 start_codon:yes stop_codon:yes gene_type:complete
MTFKLIEMVCTGNNERSPVAELIARNYLKSVGATTDYDSISSGIMVDKIKAGGFSIEVMSSVINLAKSREIYDVDELKKLNEALRNGDDQIVGQYFNQAIQIFSEEESRERRIVLGELGISGTVKDRRDQTVSRPDVVAVFPMDRIHYNGVLNIYQGSGFRPVISVMSVLATGNSDSEVANAFGRGSEAHRQRIEQLVDEVPKAVKKIIGV